MQGTLVFKKESLREKERQIQELTNFPGLVKGRVVGSSHLVTVMVNLEEDRPRRRLEGGN